MDESDRLRALAENCLAAARCMSLPEDAARLKAMAAGALERAKTLEDMSAASRQPAVAEFIPARCTATAAAAASATEGQRLRCDHRSTFRLPIERPHALS